MTTHHRGKFLTISGGHPRNARVAIRAGGERDRCNELLYLTGACEVLAVTPRRTGFASIEKISTAFRFGSSERAVFLRLLILCLLVVLMTLSMENAEESATSFAKKGDLILTDDFSKPPVVKQTDEWSGDWQRRCSFGLWTSLGESAIRAQNVPSQGHRPVVSYQSPVKNVIVECEFRLPEAEGPDRHFRIFLDFPKYRGHAIAAWANLSTVFQPAGLSLLHNPKGANNKVINEARFGPVEVDLTPGKWHLMRLEILDQRVRVTVGDAIVEGTLPALNAKKRNIALNPGKAGGELRNFRVWEALAAEN